MTEVAVMRTQDESFLGRGRGAHCYLQASLTLINLLSQDFYQL